MTTDDQRVALYASKSCDRLYLTIAKHSEPFGCGYSYVVQSRSMALTAFRTNSAFMAWVTAFGLGLESVAEPSDTVQTRFIPGQYRERAWFDAEKFAAINGRRGAKRHHLQRVRWLSNGQYTLGKITTDPDGVRVVNYMNPNYDRVHYAYAESLMLEDAGRWTEA